MATSEPASMGMDSPVVARVISPYSEWVTPSKVEMATTWPVMAPGVGASVEKRVTQGPSRVESRLWLHVVLRAAVSSYPCSGAEVLQCLYHFDCQESRTCDGASG